MKSGSAWKAGGGYGFQPFYYAVEDEKNILQSQFVQKSGNRIDIYLIIRNNDDEKEKKEIENRIINKLRSNISGDIIYNVFWVNELQMDKSGKIRFMIPKVD